jgi:hypothetical protein
VPRVVVDFDASDAPDEGPGADDDQLVAGSRHHHPSDRHHAPDHRRRAGLRRIPDLVWVAVAVGGLVIAVLATHQGGHPIARQPPGPSPSTDTSAPDRQAAALDRLVGLAQSPTAFTDNLRPDAANPPCPAVTVGTNPISALAAVLRARLPTFEVRDSSRTIDASTGLCAIAVRAHDLDGSTVIITVVPPPHDAVPDFMVERDNDRATSLDVAVVSAGWRVEVGWTGSTGIQPSYNDLIAIARNPALRW